ncbi:MAG TPA: TROVE domain-containing protein [Geminicoccaceae bacterium]|nr:TROVE domain-containing protein [Geminicoccaceae bacterium]
MATRLIRHLLSTPQWLPLPGFPGLQVRNAAGGHVFPIDDWARLDRFLILGSEGGTYYASEAELTLDNAAVVGRCLAADPARTVARVVAVSERGLAPRQAPVLLALALAAAHDRPEVRALALAALPRVARTGAHLLALVDALVRLRGTGRALKRALGAWLLDRPVEDLALQAVKYARRGGVSLRDVLRLVHPSVPESDRARRAAFEWIVRGTVAEATPALIRAASAARREADAVALARLVREARLPREAVPTALASDPRVLAATVATMPPHALVRNLNRLAAHGVVPGDGEVTALVLRRLADVEALRRARLHPFTLWVAARQYAAGRGRENGLPPPRPRQRRCGWPGPSTSRSIARFCLSLSVA